MVFFIYILTTVPIGPDSPRSPGPPGGPYENKKIPKYNYKSYAIIYFTNFNLTALDACFGIQFGISSAWIKSVKPKIFSRD